jgi:hypothetical protein
LLPIGVLPVPEIHFLLVEDVFIGTPSVVDHGEQLLLDKFPDGPLDGAGGRSAGVCQVLPS